MIKTRLDARSEDNSQFSILNKDGEVVATITAKSGGRQNFSIDTEEGFSLAKSNGHNSKPVVK